MKTINYTEARNQLAGLMEAASRDREPITITRNGAGKVVLLAIEEYKAMETTLHLHSTMANTSQIQQSLGTTRRATFKMESYAIDVAAKGLSGLSLLEGK